MVHNLDYGSYAKGYMQISRQSATKQFPHSVHFMSPKVPAGFVHPENHDILVVFTFFSKFFNAFPPKLFMIDVGLTHCFHSKKFS